MKYINIDYTGKVNNDDPSYSNGTSLVDYIEASYELLVETFGEPNDVGDGYKIDAEWLIFTPDGVATMYNYKDGKNYNGDDGMEVKDITDWHIGGRSKEVAKWIVKAIELKGGEKHE
jgi:hypothetical protein